MNSEAIKVEEIQIKKQKIGVYYNTVLINKNRLIHKYCKRCVFAKLILTSLLSYKIVMFICMKLKISIITEPIGFSILGKLYIGPLIINGFFIVSLRL